MIDSLVLTNTVTLQSVQLDQDSSNFVLDEVDLGVVDGTHHSYKYVNQIGVYIDSTTLEQRVLSISGYVIGDTYGLLENNKKILNRLINPTQPITLTLDNEYQLVFRPDYSIKYSSTYKENNEVLCKFLIQGTCPDPLFSSIASQTSKIGTISKFHFPLIIPKDEGILMGMRTSTLFLTLMNSGDVPTGILVEFSCTGAVKNPTLINVNTQEYIKINKTIVPGERVRISTLSGEKYVKGTVSGVETNYFNYLDYESTWLQLATGENTLKYDAEDNVNGLEVSVSFLPRFLEVQ